jgi:hypothetical protein
MDEFGTQREVALKLRRPGPPHRQGHYSETSLTCELVCAVIARAADLQVPTRRELVEAYDQAVAILRQAPSVRAVVPEEELEQFVGEIEQDLAQHPE